MIHRLARCVSIVVCLGACDTTTPITDAQIPDDASELRTAPNEVQVVRPEHPQPAISGGTLMIARDGRTAVAADPDLDVIWFANIGTGTPLGSLALQPGDEPGRIAQDATGRIHIVLRRGGAIVTVNPTTRTLIERRAVCPAPRGIAYMADTDSLYVACAGGDLCFEPEPICCASDVATYLRQLTAEYT